MAVGTAAPLPVGPAAPPTGLTARAAARLRTRLTSTETPARLRLLLLATVAASLLWGAAAAWTAGQQASAAGNVVGVSEPLSYDAEQIYRSLSDADATEATAFLAGIEPPAARSQYLADIARAETYLETATAAGNQGSRSELTVLSTGIPIYTGLVETARADNLQGLPVGAAYLGEASSLMRRRLLPAADLLYQQENAQLSAADGQATGLPVLAIIVALAAAFVLLRAQRWVSRRTHRSFNRGLLTASVALLLSLGWLLTAVIVARVQLLDARDRGSAPVEALAQADIATLRAHADESLTLINREGDDANQADFLQVERQLGPGPGTLFTAAASAAGGSPGARPAAAAAAAAPAWFTAHRKVRALDDSGNYDAAVQLSIGSGPASSGTLFRRVETGLTTAIGLDESAFSTAAGRGGDALTGLEAGMIAAAVVMATGCAWGLARRLAEYR
ncbi:MAG: hypothetical protein ABSF03_25995 [Streptosporangiaceae bacterium]|jgi:hypothetical protein